jgi:nitrogen regulatory protein PII
MDSPHRKLLKHNGKTIVLHDYAGLGGQDYADAILKNAEAADADLLEERLVLIDAADTVVDKSVMKAYKIIAKKNAGRLSKTAVIGATGIQKLFITTISNLFRLNVRAFDSRDEAVKWLTS